MADEEQVQSSTEETTEAAEETTQQDTTETESSTEAAEENQGGDQEEDLGQIRKDAKAFKDQKRRAEKAEADAKALREKYEPPAARRTRKDDTSALSKQIEEANARATRAEIRSAGFTHPDDHKYILDAAKRLGVDPLEAAADDLVAGKLKRMAAARETADNTPSPTRSGPARKGTKLPDFSKMSDKEFDEWEKKNR